MTAVHNLQGFRILVLVAWTRETKWWPYEGWRQLTANLAKWHMPGVLPGWQLVHLTLRRGLTEGGRSQAPVQLCRMQSKLEPSVFHNSYIPLLLCTYISAKNLRNSSQSTSQGWERRIPVTSYEYQYPPSCGPAPCVFLNAGTAGTSCNPDAAIIQRGYFS